MSEIIINGGKRLSGRVSVQGAKNSVLPVLAGTVLCGGESVVHNCPLLSDVETSLKILKHLGCKCRQEENTVIIDSSGVSEYDIPDSLMREMRSSVVFLGAVIGRMGKAVISSPGGCELGPRPIDLHLKAFKKLGINIDEEYGFIRCSCDKIKGANIDLDFPSVGATENIILATVLAEGKTTITNAAREPEIVDMIKMLKKMGANISGEGTNVIEINGVKELKSVKYRVMPDRIEAGTFLCAGAITKGKVKISNVIPEQIVPIISKLEEAGCKLTVEKNAVLIENSKRLKAVEIKTMPYPGFPTDMQSIFGAILAVAKGTSIITETIFENRFKYLTELKRMGAKNQQEGNVAIITGVKRLAGTSINSTDLRGGASLVLAGLQAKGITKVNNIEYILRGYENFDKKLNKLGANIQIEEGE